jgi:hypothetical protein
MEQGGTICHIHDLRARVKAAKPPDHIKASPQRLLQLDSYQGIASAMP